MAVDLAAPPRVSVAMPVRNAMPHLTDSVRSILDQTLEDLEFVILDDGSTDGSTEVLRELARSDRRIRLFELRESLPPAESFNYVVARCNAPLVARMDADDVSTPERLQRQADVMREADDAVAIGTLADGIDSEGRPVRPRDRWRLIRCPEIPFPHGSAMFTRRAFEEIGGYRPATWPWEDVDLFLRLGDLGRILVLPDALYSYRYHLNTTTLSHSATEAARSTRLLHRALDQRRAGRDHTSPTENGARGPVPREMVALAHRSQGALRLWAGERPRVLRQLFRGRALRFSRTGLRTLAWAVWAEVSPATLRLFLLWLIRARDRLAGVRLRDGRPCEWRLR
jgi:glycosyltransferase involved in cell wall biosynthesis